MKIDLTIWQRELSIMEGKTSLIMEPIIPLMAELLRVSSRSIFSLIIRCIPCNVVIICCYMDSSKLRIDTFRFHSCL